MKFDEFFKDNIGFWLVICIAILGGLLIGLTIGTII